jgi:hypothetical protein
MKVRTGSEADGDGEVDGVTKPVAGTPDGIVPVPELVAAPTFVVVVVDAGNVVEGEDPVGGGVVNGEGGVRVGVVVAALGVFIVTDGVDGRVIDAEGRVDTTMASLVVDLPVRVFGITHKRRNSCSWKRFQKQLAKESWLVLSSFRYQCRIVLVRIEPKVQVAVESFDVCANLQDNDTFVELR